MRFNIYLGGYGGEKEKGAERKRGEEKEKGTRGKHACVPGEESLHCDF